MNDHQDIKILERFDKSRGLNFRRRLSIIFKLHEPIKKYKIPKLHKHMINKY